MDQYFIAIEPPEALSLRLTHVMSQLGDEWPVPHVTVKNPVGLGADLAWLAPARDVVSRCEPLHVVLGPVQTFDTRVLYLAVSCPGLDELHQRLVEACASGSGGIIVDDERPYVAHLTLSRSHLDDAPRVQRWLDDLEHAKPFEVHQLTIFHREPTTHYSAWSHLALSHESSLN